MIKSILKRIRIFLLLLAKYRFQKVGKNFYCGKNLWVWRKSQVFIGNDSYIGNYCHIGVKKLNIGHSTLIASSVSFVGADHQYNDRSKKLRDSLIDENLTVSIGDDCWIGHGSIIFNGVSIGNRSIVGAGSVVTKDVPEEKIVAGNPAKIIKDRFKDQST